MSIGYSKAGALVLMSYLGAAAAAADRLSDASVVFDWIESAYPDYPAPAQNGASEWKDWIYRAYQGDSYLGLSGNDIYWFHNGFKDPNFFGEFDDLLTLAASEQSADEITVGEGPCVHVGWPSEGLNVSYQIDNVTAVAGAAQRFVEDDRFILANEDMSRKTTTSTVMLENGTEVTTETLEVEHYRVENGFRFLDTLKERTRESFAEYQNIVNTEITYPGGFNTGPAVDYCVGQTWSVGSVLGRRQARGDWKAESFVASGYQGAVTSVNESITTPAGTFDTVRLRIDYSDGRAVDEWVSIDFGVSLRKRQYGNGDLLVEREAIALY